MANQPHEIKIEIMPDGSVKSTVIGVAGPDCSKISKFLDALGKVEVDKNTADYNKHDSQNLVNRH